VQNERKLRILEGLGYIAAFMIGVGAIVESESLRYFNALGLVFAIIVIVRLMVMNIALTQVQEFYEPPSSVDSDTDESEI